ncbi:Charged multivesicular body protein 2A [Dimargaris verticillata]|uniref:Charged multivesicular body protein 2A n=1 Tax=Dimargaris verticillata TaxID=2761393 RepID=A0A9W8B8B8_9FUNG|nr:Charged multivesicular body protein 2A [Dimargaris verticillata]
MFNFLFGARKSPNELLRGYQRMLTKAMRELDRERSRLEQQETKLVKDIKTAARADQMDAAKIMARDVVRNRHYVQRFHRMKAQLQAVALRLQTLRSSQQMAEAMRGATKAMRSMNGQMNLPGLQKVMMEFERESETLDMKDELMNDAIDGVMEDDMDVAADEEESNALVNQVLDEIGLSVDDALADTPLGLKQPAMAKAVAAPTGEAQLLSDDAALQARLDNLRRE